MKVLWFANNACGSVRRNKGRVITGGWLISLEDELKKCKDIELAVAYITPREESDFVFEGVHYYPAARPVDRNGIKRVIQRYESLETGEKRIVPLLLEIVKKVSPDIIHIHGTEECFGLIQDYIQNIPIVFSIQGFIAPIAEKFYSGLPADRLKRYEPMTKRVRRVSFLDSYRSFEFRGNRELNYLQKVRYVIGRTFFDHSISLLCNPDVNLYQGEEILRSPFYEAKWDKDFFDTPLKIVSTISGGIYKGYETALHAAGLLKRYAKFPFEWQIIGYDVSSEWVGYAERYKQLDSQEVGMKLLGRKDAAEMIEIMKAADIFVQVSHIENSPNSLCEAMLLGMPCIASFAGGTASLLENNREGILVQDGDPYVLAGTIVNLHNRFEDAKKMGKNARGRATSRHNPQDICNNLISVYENIIENERKHK